MKGVIRLNDPLENGSYVNKAMGSVFMGIPVALRRDTVKCMLTRIIPTENKIVASKEIPAQRNEIHPKETVNLQWDMPKPKNV